ncbi:MAG: hypothetical protein EOO52_01710 [Gammaproteobacteria bacterium]|nr:MAG: hypothetical protein EOO52_01710 [Gammaproteobacteria bacterium]
MKFNMLILIVVVSLSSCAEFDAEPSGSEIGSMKLNCQGMSNPQRNECLSDIPPEYDKYQEDRQKLLKERAK